MSWKTEKFSRQKSEIAQEKCEKKVKYHRDAHQRPLEEEDNRRFDSGDLALFNGCASYVGVSAAFPKFWLYEEPCK